MLLFFWKGVFEAERQFQHPLEGTASLQKNPVLQLQLTHGVLLCCSPHWVNRLPNGYGESTCKLTPHWAEKALKILEHHHRLVLLLMQ